MKHEQRNPLSKIVQGSEPWFRMAGALVCRALGDSGAQGIARWRLIERYVDGEPFSDGLVQGIRFDIREGVATFRVGVQPGETADATIEVTAGVARALNLLHTDDPRFALAMEDAIRTGALVIEGDLSPISAALAVSHDAIVDRTS
ncbi:MAG: hypothetical protein DI562_10400 [Stenotrophomonas acidaminiphila]|nr:MAG: hypothetical protein DI562_10400 [Stenotrophomonas acidaminiphila]